jgi:tetraacyldisaccharide 4'-kinase
VASIGITVTETLAFPDHVHYTHAMMEMIRAKAQACGADLLVTTEKDAGKVAPFLKAADACWAVRLCTEIVSGRDRLERLLRLDPEGRPAPDA